MKRLALLASALVALALPATAAANVANTQIQPLNCSVTAYLSGEVNNSAYGSGSVSCAGSEWNWSKYVTTTVQVYNQNGNWYDVASASTPGWETGNPVQEDLIFSPVDGHTYRVAATGQVQWNVGDYRGVSVATAITAGWTA